MSLVCEMFADLFKGIPISHCLRDKSFVAQTKFLKSQDWLNYIIYVLKQVIVI